MTSSRALRPSAPVQAFTLIEILVAVVIMMVITGMVLVTYQDSIRNSQNEAARASARVVAQTANTFLAARPDVNAHAYTGLSCMTPKTFTPWGVVDGSDPTYPTYSAPPPGVTTCYLSATSTRTTQVVIVANGETFVENPQ